MARKCYISFKAEDIDRKLYIQNNLDIDMIDRSLDEPIDSSNEDYIMQVIRQDYLSDSTVTIHLIGEYGAENRGWDEQRFIKRELQASLYHGSGNTQNGILGVVLPEMIGTIYRGQISCSSCGYGHDFVAINDSTVIREFSYNYYIPEPMGCAWTDDDRFCVLVRWDDFIENPEEYIEQAFQKRSNPIANKTKVRP